MPLPASRQLEILKGTGVPLYGVEVDVRAGDSDGAALLATLATTRDAAGDAADAIGYGAGTGEIDAIPNVIGFLPAMRRGACVRAGVPDRDEPRRPPHRSSCRMRRGELRRRSARRRGTPVQMKKGRPGVVLSALARPADERRVAEALLRATSTLGCGSPRSGAGSSTATSARSRWRASRSASRSGARRRGPQCRAGARRLRSGCGPNGAERQVDLGGCVRRCAVNYGERETP